MRIVYRGNSRKYHRFGLKSDCGKVQSLTPSELKLLLALMGRPLVSNDLLIEIIWPDPDKMALTAKNVIKVHVLNLRRKLFGSGWGITARHGVGWSLTEAA